MITKKNQTSSEQKAISVREARKRIRAFVDAYSRDTRNRIEPHYPASGDFDEFVKMNPERFRERSDSEWKEWFKHKDKVKELQRDVAKLSKDDVLMAGLRSKLEDALQMKTKWNEAAESFTFSTVLVEGRKYVARRYMLYKAKEFYYDLKAKYYELHIALIEFTQHSEKLT